MKKKLIIILTMLMAVSLVACSSSKLNDNNTRTAKAIINAVDDYLDGKVDAETTYNLVHNEEQNIDESDDKALTFSIDVSGITNQLMFLYMDLGGDVGELTDHRNEVAELAGESKYK